MSACNIWISDTNSETFVNGCVNYSVHTLAVEQVVGGGEIAPTLVGL